MTGFHEHHGHIVGACGDDAAGGRRRCCWALLRRRQEQPDVERRHRPEPNALANHACSVSRRALTFAFLPLPDARDSVLIFAP